MSDKHVREYGGVPAAEVPLLGDGGGGGGGHPTLYATDAARPVRNIGWLVSWIRCSPVSLKFSHPSKTSAVLHLPCVATWLQHVPSFIWRRRLCLPSPVRLEPHLAAFQLQLRLLVVLRRHPVLVTVVVPIPTPCVCHVITVL